MPPILEVCAISKKFNIHHESRPYLSIRDSFQGLFTSHRTTHEDFWALRDVSFSVERGASTGIIGRNGAGKSTLLKVLSKITPPTSGKVISRARIASLLEVGTGFHPELTGRENIFLNGSILGMKKSEIESRFDEIVAFAGTEKFLDTELKHYSSGMQLRLAFAVAAFLEPEILVIDEVLAVGDAEFQKRCLAKMEDVSRSGRTILFVSHNLAMLEKLCPRSILLSSGTLTMEGPTADVVSQYLRTTGAADANDGTVVYEGTRPIRKLEVFSGDKLTGFTHTGARLTLKLHFNSPTPLQHPLMGVVIRDEQGQALMGINNNHYTGNLATSPVSEGVLSMTIPYLHLFAGKYYIDIYLGEVGRDIDIRKDSLLLTVETLNLTRTGTAPMPSLNKVFDPDITFGLEKLS